MVDAIRRTGAAAAGFCRRNPVPAAMLLAFALLGCGAAFLPAAPVWITDNGNKYIIMRNFAQTGELSIRHGIPGNFPTGGFHFQRTPTGFRSFYPEFLPAATALPWKLFGDRGATLLPILAGILLAGAMARYFRSFACAALAFFATPCAFYSLLLWEMIPAVLVSFLAVMRLRERKFFTGGLLLGLGLFLREEMYFLGAAAGLVLLFRKEGRPLGKLCAGSVLGALPVWLTQYLLTGHILGLHGATYYLNNRQGFDLVNEFFGVFWNYFQHLFRFETLPYFAVFGVLCIVAGFFKTPRLGKAKTALFCAGGLIFLAGAYKFLAGSAYCYTAALCAGFVTTLPLAWGFWANLRRLYAASSRRSRFLMMLAVVYTFLVPPLLTRHDVGLFWGARHFLFVMPFAIFFALRSFRFLPGGKALLAGLAAVSVAWQLCGFIALSRVSEESEQFTDSIRSLGSKVMATDIFFLPEQTPKLFFSGDFCELATEEQLTDLLAELGRRNEKDFLFITSPRWSRLAGNGRKKLAESVSGEVLRFQSPASGFMDLLIVPIRVR